MIPRSPGLISARNLGTEHLRQKHQPGPELFCASSLRINVQVLPPSLPRCHVSAPPIISVRRRAGDEQDLDLGSSFSGAQVPHGRCGRLRWFVSGDVSVRTLLCSDVIDVFPSAVRGLNVMAVRGYVMFICCNGGERDSAPFLRQQLLNLI